MTARKKLTTKLIRRINARRREGATYGDLSREFKLSAGTIATALKRKPTGRPAAASERAAERNERADLGSLPTFEDLQRSIASQVRSLEEDLQRTKNDALRASLSRLLVTQQQLLARVLPPPPPPEDADPDMMAAAARARETLKKMIDQAAEPDGPPCSACGRPLPREAG